MWHKSLFDTINQAKIRGMCLYGAGYWGQIAYRIFTKMGYKPTCFCDDDNKKQGTSYCEIPVYSLEEAVKKHPDAIYIVCTEGRKVATLNPLSYENMISQLKNLNVYDSHSELRIALYIFLLDMEYIPDNQTIQIPENIIMADDVQNLIIFNHMAVSGSWYLEQLLDEHPNILTLHYLSHAIIAVYEKRLQYLENEELLIEMTAQLTNYFHSSVNHLFAGHSGIYGSARDENGEFISDALVNADDFMKYLRMQFHGKDIRLDSLGHMLKIYAAAYSNCLGKRKQDSATPGKYWFLYHMHRVDWKVEDTYQYFHKDEFLRVENLFIIREPVQQLYSWLRLSIKKSHYNQWDKNDEFFPRLIKCEMGCVLEKKPGIENVRAIRFEDLKLQPYETMNSLCDWLGIPYDNCLSMTTINGFQVYFATSTADGNVKYITGNDTTALERKDFSEFLTLWDEVRLNMVYSKFKRAYGYKNDVPDFTEFNESTQKQILEKGNFKFADICQKDALAHGDIDSKFEINEFLINLFMDFMQNYREDTVYYEYIRPIALE